LIQLEYDVYQAIGIIIGSFALYLATKIPSKRKELRLGLLLYAYVRDISSLLIHKLSNDWVDLSIPQKLDMLKGLYDLIMQYDDVIVNGKKKNETHSDTDTITAFNGDDKYGT
jgi:hypothetical protein